MKRLLSLTSLIFFLGSLQAQILTDSNLPIIIINTDSNVGIPDAPRILASMKIIYKGVGVRNFMTDQNNAASLNYSGRINIETRGSSSQALPKNQYALSTLLADNVSNNNVSLLGMPKESDWVLNGLAFDASFIRDYLCYTLSRKIGEYAPRTVYCEVMINGDYKGLYLLQEKIKIDNHRVDIVKIKSTDNAMPDLSGGYIIKADKVTSGDPSAWTMESSPGNFDVNFIYESPKPSAITTQQGSYIQSVFLALQATTQNGNASLINGYPSLIDIPSFINFMLVNELAANVDAYQFSTFFHKDKKGKLRAGPLWDLNLTYGNDLTFWGLDRSKTYLWQFDNSDNIGAMFWRGLFNNASFKCYMAKRWNELTQTGQPLNLSGINTLIDETVAIINEAVVRNHTRWPPTDITPTLDYPSEINNIKTFLNTRMPWITTNLGSFSTCNNVQTPPLVISRIMYQPKPTTEFPDSTNQEFIEITNNGNEVVNLTGVYFSGTGFVYQFPAGYTIPAQGVFQLANDQATFIQRYGFSAFGEFTRNLSNTGQKLTLADGFGNVIDRVEYSNLSPWPGASANGSHIKLTNLNLDNNLGTSWVATDEPVATNVVTGIEEKNLSLAVYPNPVNNELNVTTSGTITGLQLRDPEGQLLETFMADSNTIKLNMNNYTAGVYFLTIISGRDTVVRKVVKLP